MTRPLFRLWKLRETHHQWGWALGSVAMAPSDTCAPVISISELNSICLGYFDPVNTFFNDKSTAAHQRIHPHSFSLTWYLWDTWIRQLLYSITKPTETRVTELINQLKRMHCCAPVILSLRCNISKVTPRIIYFHYVTNVFSGWKCPHDFFCCWKQKHCCALMISFSKLNRIFPSTHFLVL